MTAEEFLNRIDRLFADRGADEYRGEAVTQLDHALQTARLAEQANAPPELIAAALLHDIGHLLTPYDGRDRDDQHEELGYRFLARHFGPSVTEPVRLHVPAKRYLCSVDPSYAAALSPASLQSLSVQGGPMTPTEMTAFDALPYAAAAVALRRWDDAAKVVGRVTPPFAYYRRFLEITRVEHSA
jgi:phosphonate degradation associated HDIG domain protein